MAKSERKYTIRIWQDGQLVKTLGPFKRREAARIWRDWFFRDCGTELLVNGKHIPLCQAGKMLGLKPSASRVALEGTV